jgi:hypothetical protein
MTDQFLPDDSNRLRGHTVPYRYAPIDQERASRVRSYRFHKAYREGSLAPNEADRLWWALTAQRRTWRLN